MKNARTSVAFYSVSSDVDGAKIAQQMAVRSNKAIVEMLRTSKEQLTTDPQLAASMLQGAMVGVSRKILESTAPEKQFESLRPELIFFASTYLKACSTRPAAQSADSFALSYGNQPFSEALLNLQPPAAPAAPAREYEYRLVQRAPHPTDGL
jgi:hypothetical protein